MIIDFEGKVVVVTGGASGIGLATVRQFLADGATVVVLDIASNGTAIVTELGEKAHSILCDVSVAEQVESAFLYIRKHFGKLDILINNAGIQSYGNVTETSLEDWDRVVNTNLKSVFLCSKYGIPLLLSSPSPVIVNVSSVKAFICQDNEAAYITSKTAIIGLTRSIATDYRPKLRCVAVCPGAVNTPLLQDELNKSENKELLTKETAGIHLLDRIAEPEEIAAFIVFLASEKASFTTGQAFRVDGGIGVRIEGT